MVTEKDIQIIGMINDVLDLTCKSGIHSITMGYYTVIKFILFGQIKCKVIVNGVIQDTATAKEKVLKMFNQ